MAFHFQSAWHPLIGRQVAIRRQGNVVRYGTVDAVTRDDEVLWLRPEGPDPRQLYEKSEGFEVWVDYKWERHDRADREPSGSTVSA
ncbi:hypothetical protein E4J89_15880 [Arthrobacter sp. CAU 1506]|nr:hypothetical protein E4J89_15880 [Arthrobacter sp. CAU 1506]